jgi:hypothetical protein
MLTWGMFFDDDDDDDDDDNDDKVQQPAGLAVTSPFADSRLPT